MLSGEKDIVICKFYFNVQFDTYWIQFCIFFKFDYQQRNVGLLFWNTEQLEDVTKMLIKNNTLPSWRKIGESEDRSRFDAISIKYFQILNGTLNLHNDLKLLRHYIVFNWLLEVTMETKIFDCIVQYLNT